MERKPMMLPTGVVRCMSVTNARRELNRLVAGTNSDGVPVHIISPKGNAVLVSEDDWNALQETLYLQSVPGLTRQLKDAASAPDSDFTPAEEVTW